MKKYLSALLALFFAVCAIQPSFGAASTTVMSRVNFENTERTNNKLFKDTMISNLLLMFPFYMLANPSEPNVYGNYGKFVLQSTLGQNTTFTIPDPGSATASFVVTPGSSSSLLQHATIPLTAANLIAMYATPVQLVAAGAAGTNIVVQKVLFTITTTATAFTGGGVLEFQIGNTAHGAGTATTATIAAAVVTAGAGTSYTTVIPVSYTGTAATGLFISNQTAAFAAGTGTAIVDVWYSVE
jgi:hypothetical protein